MRMRLLALFALSALTVGGILAVDRASIAQSPPASSDATPSATTPAPPAAPTANPAPGTSTATPAPAAAPDSNPPGAAAPVTVVPPAAPIVSAQPTQPAAVVAAPPAQAPAPVVTAPPAEGPAPVVTAPAATPAAPAVATPVPVSPQKPDIGIARKEAAEPAKVLFSETKLPSVGKPQAIGYYPRGCLQGGVALPVTGKTWQVMRLSRNRNWGHPELVKFLERFAPLAAKATGWHGILIGDMAQPRGGPLPFGHMSHQIGLDVDIWLTPMPAHVLSKEQREKMGPLNLVAPDWKRINPKTWTPAEIAFIRTAAEQPEVERVLVNAAIKKKICQLQGDKHPAWMDKVRPWYGHNDHMHVRLKCPADSPHCRHQPPVPDSAACGKPLDYWFSDRVLHPMPRKGGKPPKQIMLADLPPACKTVLNAPAKMVGAGVQEVH